MFIIKLFGLGIITWIIIFSIVLVKNAGKLEAEIEAEKMLKTNKLKDTGDHEI